MRRHLTALLCASLLLAACGGNDDSGDSSAITSIPDDTTTTSSTTTEPRTVAPDVIPQDVSLITEEYVEQVLNELFGVSLEAFISSRETGVVEERTLALLDATSSDGVFEQRVNDLSSLAAGGFAGMKEEPGPVVVSVVDLLHASADCIAAEVTTDASRLMTDPPPMEPGERDFVRLLPASVEQLSSGLNPTAWVLDEFPVTFDGSVPDLRCESQ